MTDAGWHGGVSNAGPDELLVWLEPWAEEFGVAVRSTITLTVSGSSDKEEPIEVESTPDHLVLWASAGQRVRIFIDGIPLETASAQMTVPGGNGSTRQFLTTLFAKEPAARLGGRSFVAGLPPSLFERAKRRLGW